jgi:hypothetical protein
MVSAPVTTVVDHGQPTDQRTGLHPMVRQPTSPFRIERLQGDSLTLENLSRKVLAVEETVQTVTEGVRQMPEGGARTLLVNVDFVIGQSKTLNHLLGVSTAADGAIGPSTSVQASSPEQIKFELLNHRVAFGGAYRSAVDERTITLVPSATFTADVRLFVVA